MDNVELKFIKKPSGAKKWMEPGQFGMFWKFYPFDDNDVEIWMARDADSRISLYEKEKIDNFIKSNKIIHSFLFNNNGKGKKLRGGTSCFKNYTNNNDNRKGLKIKELINNFVDNKEKTPFYTDEKFLNNIFYPEFKDKYHWDNQCHKLNKLKNLNKKIIATSCEEYNIDYVGRVVDEYDVSCQKNNNHWYKYNYDDFYNIINSYKLSI